MVALALAVPLDHLLHIHSVGIVVLTETTLVTALISPVALGLIQGFQRFHALAAMYVLPLVLRLVIFAIVAAAGYRLGGAIFASVVSAIVAAVWSLVLIREPLRLGLGLRTPDLRSFLRYLRPVAAGLIGIALLTHVDILIVKARFSADDAGAYAAASAFARVGFFLPATILAVLFPRTAARQARGEETEDILGRSLLATFAFCAGLAVFYAATGVGLVTTTFGVGFAKGGHVLAVYALAIGLFSLAYILVGYHLSRGESRYAWIVAGGVVAQIVLLAVVPSSLHGVVWTNLGVGAALLAAHEVFVGSSAPALRAGLRHLSGPWTRVRAVLPEAALALVGSTALVVALFWPVVVHLGSTIIGTPGSDSTGSVSWFWQLQHESGYHLLGTMHHTLTGAPFGWRENNGLNLQWLLPYYPGYLATKVVGPVAAFNLVVLSGYVLSGFSMYVLARYLGCVRLVAAWAAVVFIVFPWHLARAEHASLVHLEVLAFVVLALVAAARRPSWQRFLLVGVATLACWLTSGYFGAMAVVTTVAFTLGAALTGNRRRGVVLVLGSTASALVATAVVGIGAVGSGTNTGAGLGRVAGDLSIYGLRPIELFVPTVRNLVFGGSLESFWTTHTHGSNPTEVSNDLGVLTFALALLWLVFVLFRRARVRSSQRAATAGLVAAFGVGLLCAAPSPILLFGHKVWMPSRILWELTPAFRVPARWDPLLMTALLPLAALGLQTGWRMLARRRRRLVVPAVVVSAAIAVSFVELTIRPARNHFRTVPAPAEYSAVEQTPRGSLAEYPLGYSDIYKLWQRVHGRPLVNDAPPSAEAPESARLMLLDPAQQGTASALSLLGVTAIAIHPGAQVDAEVPPRDPASDPGYRLVGRYPDGSSVWRVVAPPAPAFATLPGGFGKPQLESNGVVAYPLIASGGVATMELRAKEPGVIRLTFDVVPPSGTQGQHTVRIADAEHEQAFTIGSGPAVVSVDVNVPRGVSQLLVKVDPAPTSETDALALTAPRAERASGQPVLSAQPLSPDAGF